MPRAYTKQQLQEQYEKLPAVLKDALYSVETADKVHEIGKKSGLTIEKMGFMAEEIGRVILGLTRPGEFIALLAERLETDKDTARKIALDINHQIFFLLREALKQAHQIEMGEAALQPRAPLPQRTAPAPEERPKQPISPIGPIISVSPKPGSKQPSIVDLGGLRPLKPGPSDFLSREEVKKLVAGSVASKIPTIDLSRTEARPPEPTQIKSPPLPAPVPPTTPQVSQVLSTPPPQSSPQLKIQPIDLRWETKPPAKEPSHPIPPTQPPAPAVKQLTAEPLRAAQPPAVKPQEAPPTPPEKSSIPPIDLRQPLKPPAPEKPKPKPWSGYDPYKEPVE